MPQGWPWPILRQGQIWSLMLLYGKKGKTMDFSETIIVYDIKVDSCSLLNEYMKLYEYQRPRLFIDLGPNLSDSTFLNFFSSITIRLFEAKFHVESPMGWENKSLFKWSRSRARWPPCPYMVKTFNQRTIGPVSLTRVKIRGYWGKEF